jgi:hypothetical protein
MEKMGIKKARWRVVGKLFSIGLQIWHLEDLL